MQLLSDAAELAALSFNKILITISLSNAPVSINSSVCFQCNTTFASGEGKSLSSSNRMPVGGASALEAEFMYHSDVTIHLMSY